MELDEVEDNHVFDWLYDHQPLKYSKKVNGSSYRYLIFLFEITIIIIDNGN